MPLFYRCFVLHSLLLVGVACTAGPVDEVAEGEGDGEVNPLPDPRLPEGFRFTLDGADVTDTGVEFGNADIGGSAVARTITLENGTDADLTILSDPPILLGGRDVTMWAVTQQPGIVVPARGEVRFTVELRPTSPGPLLGVGLFAYGTTAGERAIIAMQGAGVGDADLTGVRYALYQGTFDAMPNFDGLTPVDSGVQPGFSIAGGVAAYANSFAYRFASTIDLPSDGTWTFYTTSDDGSLLFIDGTRVVANDFVQPPTERSGQLELSAGRHSIEVQYFEKDGGEALEVRYEGPGQGKDLIPSSVLFQ